jgi:hypothetical protein
MMHHLVDQRRTWRNAEIKTAQHQRCIEEIEMRTWNHEDSDRQDQQ